MKDSIWSDQTKMATPKNTEKGSTLLGGRVADPRQRLVNRIATCLLHEPNFYQTEDQKIVNILEDL
jgi:hypothetical protein